jgi:hypothetical protein
VFYLHSDKNLKPAEPKDFVPFADSPKIQPSAILPFISPSDSCRPNVQQGLPLFGPIRDT